MAGKTKAEFGASGQLDSVDRVFNGWGGQDWACGEHGSKIARQVADLAGVPVLSSPLVNEGGALHVDGEGSRAA
jgi:agmatine deiminase